MRARESTPVSTRDGTRGFGIGYLPAPPFPEPDWTTMDTEYAPRAARRLRATPIPGYILAQENWSGAREFMRLGEAAGMIPEQVPQTVDWAIVRRELAGERVRALSVGEYLLGVNSGARNSVDRTYLAQAETPDT